MALASFSPGAVYWLSFEAFVAAIQIAACVLVLRENSAASRIMLGGALISVLARVAFYVAAVSEGVPFHMVAGALSLCIQAGTVIFLIGLLLHARRRRAMARRVEELERFLSARAEA